ncbi:MULTISPECIES: class I SAM-dependent methyltransferase, partial [unclassified Novosphingobium]|uniref:class I SAM-dependent methyltransferase n=1 Tax=unclassified Novosphingobium TaxID=2644732 RepID=UPI001357B06F
MPAQNAYQVADWNGRSGERWATNQQRLDAMLAVFGEAAIAAAAPAQGEKVLDVGCGAGASSFALAELVGAQGRVVGLDISAPLIAHARALARADAPVEFRVADAAADLGLSGFDLLYSRFGAMFFDDPAAAFTALRGALKPGGRLAFVCWQGASENDWIRLPMGAIRDLLPPPPPPAPE